MGFCGVFSFVLYSSLSPKCLVIVFVCMFMCELSDTYMYLYIYVYIHRYYCMVYRTILF